MNSCMGLSIGSFSRLTALVTVVLTVGGLLLAAVRSLAGPGHVIYTGISGYYLGLAKSNPKNRGAIMVKGVLIAALIHATYDTLSTYLPAVIAFGPVVFVVFILIYDGIFGGFLLRKLARYRSLYREAIATSGPNMESN